MESAGKPDLLERAHVDAPDVKPYLPKVFKDYPNYETNVFIIMRFHKSTQFAQLTAAVRDGLRTYGLTGIRADDKNYTDDLWSNIRACMWCCKYGLAVLEDIDDRSFNCNIALEYGYMLGLGRRVLLLREKRLQTVPSDIAGRLWKTFDAYDINTTIIEQIASWGNDLGLRPIGRQEAATLNQNDDLLEAIRLMGAPYLEIFREITLSGAAAVVLKNQGDGIAEILRYELVIDKERVYSGASKETFLEALEDAGFAEYCETLWYNPHEGKRIAGHQEITLLKLIPPKFGFPPNELLDRLQFRFLYRSIHGEEFELCR
jgi:hypothetical protein